MTKVHDDELIDCGRCRYRLCPCSVVFHALARHVASSQGTPAMAPVLKGWHSTTFDLCLRINGGDDEDE